MISNFPEIFRQNFRISGGNIGKSASIVLLSAKFLAVRTVVVDIRLGGTKSRLRTKVEYRWSTFDQLFMRGMMKAKGLIIMIIIYEFITRKYLCNFSICTLSDLGNSSNLIG